MRIRFTEHAVDRFIERLRPGGSRLEVLEEMRRMAAAATPVRQKSSMGDSQLLADGVIFVLKHDRDDGQAECPTVLFDDRQDDTNALAREIVEFGVLPCEALQAPVARRRHSRKSARW